MSEYANDPKEETPPPSDETKAEDANETAGTTTPETGTESDDQQ